MREAIIAGVQGSSKVMITGRQIREARSLLRWSDNELAKRTKIAVATIHRAEALDGEPPITFAQAANIQGVLERAGFEFLTGEEPGVRLRNASGA